MPSAKGKFRKTTIRLPDSRGAFHGTTVDLTDAEYERVSAEAYSREISRSELIRRALAHFFACQDTAIDEIVKPPKDWRMPRPTLTA